MSTDGDPDDDLTQPADIRGENDPEPNHEPVPPSQGTLTRLVGHRTVRYFVTTVLITVFLTIFTVLDVFIASVMCVPRILQQATNIATAGATSESGSILATLKAQFISCLITQGLHPGIVFVSFLAACVICLPLYKTLQSIDRGELLRSVL